MLEVPDTTMHFALSKTNGRWAVLSMPAADHTTAWRNFLATSGTPQPGQDFFFGEFEQSTDQPADPSILRVVVTYLYELRYDGEKWWLGGLTDPQPTTIDVDNREVATPAAS